MLLPSHFFSSYCQCLPTFSVLPCKSIADKALESKEALKPQVTLELKTTFTRLAQREGSTTDLQTENLVQTFRREGEVRVFRRFIKYAEINLNF